MFTYKDLYMLWVAANDPQKAYDKPPSARTGYDVATIFNDLRRQARAIRMDMEARGH